MQKSNVGNSWKLERISWHKRSKSFFPFSLFLLSVIGIIVTLPMISCMDTTPVDSQQFSRLAFQQIGCKGTYNSIQLKMLSQICFDHSEGYNDIAYKNCRSHCFTTDAFKSSAAMQRFALYRQLEADAWIEYRQRIRALSGVNV